MKKLNVLLIISALFALLFIPVSCDINDTDGIPYNETATYTNGLSGYRATYAKSWIKDDLTINPDGSTGLTLKNKADAVLAGQSDFNLTQDGSVIYISVIPGMNFSNYEDFVKNSGYLNSNQQTEFLKNIGSVNIGGVNLQARYVQLPTSKGYDFIYNNKLYKINLTSGSEAEFKKDEKVFDDLIKSFQFI